MRTAHPTLFLALAVTLGLAACGGGNPKTAAWDAYNSGDYPAAVAKFDSALRGVEAGSPDHVALSVGRCQALAHQDGKQAKTEFLALATSAEVEVGDYTILVNELLGLQQWVPAIELMDAGVKAFPENPKMGLLRDKVVAKSKESGDAGANAALKGLGYL
jgi:hypothetical protein